MKKVNIIGGGGYVGKALVEFFQSHPDFNVVIQELGFAKFGLEDLDLAVICVPTPMSSNGECDTSIVEEVIDGCNAPLILIKSAVPPGTTERLKKITGKRIVVSPEYIGEGKYTMPYWQNLPHPTDMKKHDFQIFGGDKRDTKECVEIFSRVLGPYCKFYQTDANTAELTKYMENCFFATKITFCHEFFNIAKVFGVDYHELRELWLADGRVNRGSTAVFDPDNLGYGGKCLPKDIAAIFYASTKAGFSPKLLAQVINVNYEQRNQND